jgi:hypothetical protein
MAKILYAWSLFQPLAAVLHVVERAIENLPDLERRRTSQRFDMLKPRLRAFPDDPPQVQLFVEYIDRGERRRGNAGGPRVSHPLPRSLLSSTRRTAPFGNASPLQDCRLCSDWACCQTSRGAGGT